MKLRSGKTYQKNRVPNLPLNVINKIMKMTAASGPSQRKKISQVSNRYSYLTKNARAANAIRRAQWKHITSRKTRMEYLHGNIPHRLGKLALRLGNNQGIGPQYKIRENIKKNFRARILPRGPTNVNGTNRYFENNRYTYHLNQNGILRRNLTHNAPGAATYTQYIGKI